IIVGAPALINENLVKFVIVLVCLEPNILKSRMKERGYSPIKIAENMEAELVGEYLGEIESFYPTKKIHIIDGCKNNLEQVLTKVREFFR
ncbi:MAG: hypothetical protein ACFFD1_08180, partial [Candidatus Thorarchaeota archaeon]